VIRYKRAGALGLGAALIFPLAGLPASANPDKPDVDITPIVNLSNEPVRVMVVLKNQPADPSTAAETSNLSTQDSLIQQWGPKYGLEIDRQFGYLINGFSATVPADQIFALSQEPQVESVKRERVYYPTEHTARDISGVPAAYENFGVDGTGLVISIIDSGIDVNHQDMRLDDPTCENVKIQPDTANGFTCKVPNGFNYADENLTVKDTTSSQHGMHVAGIVAANGSEGDTPPDVIETGRFDGVAPNAQLLAMKVFSNDGSGGAYDADILAAIEDSVKLGADIINMSLGSPNGQNDPSDGAYRAIEAARAEGVLTVVAAGNDGINFSQTAELDDIFGLHDDATIGAPSTQGAAFTVASIDNTVSTVPLAYWNDGTDHQITYVEQGKEPDGQSYELVDVGLARVGDFPEEIDLTGRYALVERGDITFTEKFQNSVDHGAAGVVVYNSPAGGEDFVYMGGIEGFDVFSASIYRSDGLAIKEALASGPVSIRFTLDSEIQVTGEGLTPSAFTSWGPTPTLDFEPEIAGIGGNVYSTLGDNKYGMKSGTSMAAPNVAGLSALLLENYKTRFPSLTGPALLDQVEIALMNTAEIPTSADGVPYAPRQIGAGLARIDRALETSVFATVDGSASVALGQIGGAQSFTVNLTNLGDTDVTYTVPAQRVVNETNEAFENTTTFVSGESLTASATDCSRWRFRYRDVHADARYLGAALHRRLGSP